MSSEPLAGGFGHGHYFYFPNVLQLLACSDSEMFPKLLPRLSWNLRWTDDSKMGFRVTCESILGVGVYILNPPPPAGFLYVASSIHPHHLKGIFRGWGAYWPHMLLSN